MIKRITWDYLLEHKTERGGYTRHQLEALGLSWPPLRDWERLVLGRIYPPEALEEFERGKYVLARSTFKKQKKQKKKKNNYFSPPTVKPLIIRPVTQKPEKLPSVAGRRANIIIRRRDG